jgi:uncharacterized protein YacL
MCIFRKIKNIKIKIAFKKSLKVFLSFLIFGIVVSVVEDLVAIHYATDYSIDIQAFYVAVLVAIPFAVIGEIIVDRTHLLPKASKNKNIRHLEIFLEFMIFGVIMGVIEDLIAISILTGESITFHILWIVTIITIPFAILGEVIVDRKDWFSFIKTNKIDNI